MSEQGGNKGPEKDLSSEALEVKGQLEKVAEKLRENAEKESNSSERKREELEVKKSAEKLAISGKERAQNTEQKHDQQPTDKHSKHMTYKATMRRVEAKLPAYQRVFSRMINNDTVDKVSNISGKTIARPSGLLGGGIFAFIGLLIVSYIANKQGFEVSSGSVFINLLIIGWLTGIAVELLLRFIRRN